VQIKAVVTQPDMGFAEEDSSGPLAEIQFWRDRGEDLAGICAQIESPGN
jgi:hypothetical protein